MKHLFSFVALFVAGLFVVALVIQAMAVVLGVPG